MEAFAGVSCNKNRRIAQKQLLVQLGASPIVAKIDNGCSKKNIVTILGDLMKKDVANESVGSSKTQNYCSKKWYTRFQQKSKATKILLVPAKKEDGGNKLIY